MVAQGQEVVRLAEAVARLEQGAAMKIRTRLADMQMSSPTSVFMLVAYITLRVLADTTQQMTACCAALMRCVAVMCQVQGCCCSDHGHNGIDTLVFMFIALQVTIK